MSIQSFVHDALNALKEIATNGTVDAEIRINAAEKILDYASKMSAEKEDKTDAIGFLADCKVDSECRDFGAYLRNLRQVKGLTVRKLEKLSGVSQSYITNIENGKRDIPSPAILKNLSEPLDVEYLVLMEKAGYISGESA